MFSAILLLQINYHFILKPFLRLNFLKTSRGLHYFINNIKSFKMKRFFLVMVAVKLLSETITKVGSIVIILFLNHRMKIYKKLRFYITLKPLRKFFRAFKRRKSLLPKSLARPFKVCCKENN